MESAVVPLHGFEAPPPLSVRVALFAAAGIAATVVANAPMARLDEGQTPPFVAASALTGEPPAEVSPALASAVHYVAGALAGVVFALLSAGLERPAVGLPTEPHLPETAVPAVPALLAALGIFGFLYAVFGALVLPLFGGFARERARRIRRDWAVSAGVYTAALLVAATVLTAAFG